MRKSVTLQETVKRLRQGSLWTDVLALCVLGIVLFYMLYFALQMTYLGINFSGNWEIIGYESGCSRNLSDCFVGGVPFEIGDRLLVVDGVSAADYAQGFNWTLLPGAVPGEVVELIFERSGQPYRAQWRLPEPSIYDRLYRLLGLLLVLPFWLAGTVVLLLLYPRDTRWRLLVGLYYLLTLWLTVGTLSSQRALGTVETTVSISWLLMPVFLHLHLLIPSPLLSDRARRIVLISAYVVGAIGLAPTLLKQISGIYAYAALLLAILGTTGLLIYQAFGRKFDAPSHSSARLMLAGIGLAFGPSILLWVVPSLLAAPTPDELTIALISLTLPAHPFFYIYAIYKRTLGTLEFRASRILASYSYLILFATGFVFLYLIAGQIMGYSNDLLTFSLTVSALSLTLAYYLRAPYLRLARKLAYGTAHDPDHMVTFFANAIPQALNRQALAALLVDEVLPPLLVRQSALLTVDGSEVSTLFTFGIETETLPQRPNEVSYVQDLAAAYRAPELTGPGPYAWVRLALPVKVGETVMGLWIFGKRDPDDFYPLPDINLLVTLANQVGVALENIRLFDDLRQRADELQVAYDDLRELDRLKEEFIQNISHELRTPLTLVQGYVELMREGLLGEVNEEQKEALDIVFDRTVFTVRMVNDIISIQQALVQRHEMNQVDVVDVARKSLRMTELADLREQVGPDGLPAPLHHFYLRVKGEVPLVLGVRSRLGQIFDNLLGNAIKFSPRGGEISIDIEPCYHRYDIGESELVPLPAIEIAVRDQGVGIPADKIDHIWDRFYQVDGSSTRQFGGMGLGLSIVKEIVASHAGFIWVESREGQGSIFRFVLPTAETYPRLASKEGAPKATLLHSA